MSSHHYLYCRETDECVEVIACVGNWRGPRLDANAVQAFLTYHFLTAPGAALVIWESESIAGGDLTDSMKVLAEQRDLADGDPRDRLPALVWTGENYRTLAERAEGLSATLHDYEQAPGGGRWVRKTSDGRII